MYYYNYKYELGQSSAYFFILIKIKKDKNGRILGLNMIIMDLLIIFIV